MNDWLFRGDFNTAPANVPAILLGLALAFLGGHVIAWVYMATHSGLSYSKSFVNSLMVIPSVVALVMMVLSNTAADVLYGVSMGGDGITKVVSRKLPSREQPLEAVADADEAAA